MLIVEDGSQVENANSYATLEAADAYCVPRGLWPLTPMKSDAETGTETPDAEMKAAKESAMMRAFDYLNSFQWKGQPVDWQRTAAWPRSNVQQPGNDKDFLPPDMVPKAVVQSQIELAALIYGGLNPLAPVERGGKVLSESHSTKEGDVDVIGGDSKSDSYTYAESAPIETFFPAISGLLAPFLAVVPGKSGGAACVEVGRG